jgi:hypothetical protein
MEVHPPHGPVQSIKEFMVHLLAITIGLLIALGLESTVEWFHHRHLVHDARENIRAEIRANEDNVLRHAAAMPLEEKRLQAILANVEEAERGRPQKALGAFNWTFNFPVDSAWNATSSSGAIAWMKYEEVKRYSRLYDFQRLYASYVEHYLEERHEMNILLARMNEGNKLPEAELENGKRTIESEIIRTRELREMDSTLGNAYAEMLAREK